MRLVLLPPVLFLALTIAPGVLRAQGEDAFPLPRGTFRVEAAGLYAGWDEFRGDGGVLNPLGAAFSVPLTGDNLAPLAAAQTELNRFFRATDAGDMGPLADAGNFTLGELELQAAAERTEVPFRVEVGLTDRLGARLGVRLGRERVDIQGFSLAGGTVGTNPDPAANAAALAAIDSSYAALGGSPFLPLADSPLGEVLRQRAGARGGTLSLPDSMLDRESTAELLPDGPERRWRAETAEAGLRVQLLGPGDRAAAPRGTRAAVSLDASYPLAGNIVRSPLLPELRGGATPELRAAVYADLGAVRRLWASVGARYTLRGDGEIERFDPQDPFSSDSIPTGVRVDPGDDWAVEVTPRFQLTDEISLGAAYVYARRGGDAFAEAEVTGERSSQAVGFGARYATLPAWLRGDGRVPVEAELRVRTVVGGSGGVPDATVLELRGRVYRRLWGGH